MIRSAKELIAVQPIIVSQPHVSFQETPYGILKRIRVISDWAATLSRQQGRSSLTILDYGCGIGNQISYPLACLGHSVLGVDIHEASIREASRRYDLPTLSFRVGQLEDLVPDSLTFDLIVCSEVLEHIREPLRFLQLIRQLVKPNGNLIFTTPNGYGSYEMLCRLERGLNWTGVHQLLRWIFRGGRHLAQQLYGLTTSSPSVEILSENQNSGFLNRESVHVQFFRLRTLETIFQDSGFHVVSRRARTLFCGPYVDLLFRICPFRQSLFRMNNRLADLLPFAWAADWMFLLERRKDIHS